MPYSTGPRLILCPDLAAYRQVLDSLAGAISARLNIPLLKGQSPQLQGFPPEIPVIDFAGWEKPDSEEFTPQSDGRICLALEDDPACAAVARYLCLATGKDLRYSTAGPEWEVKILEIAAEPALQSLTLVLPSWSGRELDPGWLLRTLNLMRSPRLRHVSWGLITGHEPAVISQLAAKAVLQTEIMAAYRAAPTVIISNYEKEALHTPVERVNLTASRAGFQLFDQKWIDEGFPRQVLHQPLQALIFKGHGRNYCAIDGYMCGARPLTQAPNERPHSCVLGMQCAASTFPQLDPRAYDAPVMLMDSCGTGNWAAYVWQTGLPSLAYYAVAGSPGAVITEDGVTINGAEDYLDTIWSLVSAPTMGQATTRFNLARREDNPIPPYFLLGDPDIPAGESRWPEWATTLAEPQPLPARQPGGALWLVTVPPHRTKFLRVRLPQVSPGLVTFVWSLEPGAAVNNARYYRLENEGELFLTFDSLPTTAATLLIEQAPGPSLPDGVVQAAMELSLITGSWLEPLEAARMPLLEAAQQVLHTAGLLEQISGKAVTLPYDELAKLVKDTRAAWFNAHRQAIKVILKFAPYSLWPSSLWTSYNYQGVELETPCPHCGLAPTILRTGQTVPGKRLPRQGLECLRCDLVEDVPVRASNPVLRMPVPAKIRPGQFQVELEIDNSGGDTTFWGAGAILMDRSGHGVSASPQSFVIEAKIGEKFKTSVTMTLPGDPPISHQYRVRAMILLNGDWFWLSRTVVVHGHDRTNE